MARNKPDSCIGCNAYNYGIGFVTSVGPEDGYMQVVGQGPGEQEAHTCVPFYPEAPAGWRLTRWLNRQGIPRTAVWISNVVWCWLPKTRTPYSQGSRAPTAKEAAWCWNAHLGPVMHKLRQDVPIVTVGSPATQAFLGKSSERLLGTPNYTDLKEIKQNG